MAALFNPVGFFSRKKAAAALVILLLERERKEKRSGRAKRKEKRLWRRRWLAKRDEEQSVTNQLMQEFGLDDDQEYMQWMLLTKCQFYELLEMVEPSIKKTDTQMRKAVTAEERLAITLRYLVTGESQSSLSYQFRVSQNLISSIIPEVCTAIYHALQPKYMVVPATQEEWKNVAQGFNTHWNFPNCIGALDGKRVLLEKPPNAGSEFYDYQSHFSIILMALVDSDYKFLYMDVGTNGHASDAGVWHKCNLHQAVEGNDFNIPPPSVLPLSNVESPYVIVGDDAFPLKTYIMKPYPGQDLEDEKKIFNYRLSRARRVSENAFGIMASRFQIYKQGIRSSPHTITNIVKATVVLHNYLRVNSKNSYSPIDLLDREDTNQLKVIQGQWHQNFHSGLMNLQSVARRSENDAVEVRDRLKTYFNTDGQVPWQQGMASLH